MQQIKEKARTTDQLRKTALANADLDTFTLGVTKLLTKFLIQSMAQNDAIATRYMEDNQFHGAVLLILAKDIHATVRPEESISRPSTRPIPHPLEFLEPRKTSACSRLLRGIGPRIVRWTSGTRILEESARRSSDG